MLKEVFLMKTFGKEFENRTVEALNSCLSKVPFLKIEDIVREPSKAEGKPDLLVKIELPDSENFRFCKTRKSRICGRFRRTGRRRGKENLRAGGL